MFGTLSSSRLPAAQKYQPSPLKPKSSSQPQFGSKHVNKDEFQLDLDTVNNRLAQMKRISLTEELPPTAGSPREMGESSLEMVSSSDALDRNARQREADEAQLTVKSPAHVDQKTLSRDFQAITKRFQEKLPSLQSGETFPKGYQTLLDALQNKDREAVHQILKTDKDFNQTDGTRQAIEDALQLKGKKVIKGAIKTAEEFNALQLEDKKAIKRALKAAEKFSQIDNSAMPLQEALRSRNHDAMNRLVKAGVNLNQTDSAGLTPLMKSVKEEDVFATRSLLKFPQNLNLDLQDRDGKTALNHAASTGNVEAAALLLDAGASTSIPDKSGKLPIDQAIESWDYQMFETLIAGGAGKNNGASIAHALEKLDTIEDPVDAHDYVTGLLTAGLNVLKSEELKRVLAKKPELNIAEEADEYIRNTHTNRRDGASLLMRAANKGNLEAVKQLTEAGADVLQTDTTGSTALHYASRKKRKVIVAYLQEAQEEAQAKREAQAQWEAQTQMERLNIPDDDWM